MDSIKLVRHDLPRDLASVKPAVTAVPAGRHHDEPAAHGRKPAAVPAAREGNRKVVVLASFGPKAGRFRSRSRVAR